MKRNMRQWLEELRTAQKKKALPVLSFPCITPMGITVRDLIGSAELQARGMKTVADRCDSAAAVSMMDLSVEAEALGAPVRLSDEEVPAVTGHVIDTEEQARALVLPAIEDCRTGRYVEAMKLACDYITDRPVFAGVIGPFSLAGRLLDVTEIMMLCYDEPEMVHAVLEKATEFIITYIKAYRATGAGGVVVAEPLAGLLSPSLMEEFAAPYMKQVVDAVQDDEFIVIYHNCGGAVRRLVEPILACGAAAYHFGNAVDIEDMLKQIPPEVVVLGNIDPVSGFTTGTPAQMREQTLALLERCSKYPNFVISSGCDIPPRASWENIDAFFAAVGEFYSRF